MACYTEVYYITADSSKQTGDQVFVIGRQPSQLRRLHLEKSLWSGWRSDSTAHKESLRCKTGAEKGSRFHQWPGVACGCWYTGRMEPSGLTSQTQGWREGQNDCSSAQGQGWFGFSSSFPRTRETVYTHVTKDQPIQKLIFITDEILLQLFPLKRFGKSPASEISTTITSKGICSTEGGSWAASGSPSMDTRQVLTGWGRQCDKTQHWSSPAAAPEGLIKKKYPFYQSVVAIKRLLFVSLSAISRMDTLL